MGDDREGPIRLVHAKKAERDMSVSAVNARLLKFAKSPHCDVETHDDILAILARAQGVVKMPESVDEAIAMEALGFAYLKQHAPKKLTTEGLARQGPGPGEAVAWRRIDEHDGSPEPVFGICSTAYAPTPFETWFLDGAWRLYSPAEEKRSAGVTKWFPTHFARKSDLSALKGSGPGDAVAWRAMTPDMDHVGPAWCAVRVYTGGKFLRWDVHYVEIDDETGEIAPDFEQGWALNDYEFWMPIVPPDPPAMIAATPTREA